MKKILLEGYFGYGNIGDEAICASLIEELEELYRENCEIVIMSRDPDRSSKIHGKESVKCETNLKSSFFQILKYDKLIFCGGGRYGKFTHRRIALLALLAKMLGKKVDFRAIGFYPFEWRGFPVVKTLPLSKQDPLTRVLTRAAFKLADRVTVRDKFSRECLRLFGIRREIEIEEDLALKLKPLSAEDIEPILSKYDITLNEKTFRIGINLRTLHPRINSNVIAVLQNSLKSVMQKHTVKIVFTPFGYGSSPNRFFDNDITIAKSLKKSLGGNLIIIEEELKPQEMLTIFNFFDLFIGMRLHSIIFAGMMDIPTIALVYDVKVEEFLEKDEHHRILLRINVTEINDRTSSELTSTIINAIGSNSQE